MTESSLLFKDPVTILPGMTLLPQFAQSALLKPALESVCEVSPIRQMKTRRGQTIQVSMTNCGHYGWVSDAKGYRYTDTDPVTGELWPAMPQLLVELATGAANAAGFSGFVPDACLINRYAPGVQMGAHQDRDEQDFTQPIVSVSLGIPARFFVLGLERCGTSTPVDLKDGDVVVFGGPARLYYHGIRKLKPNEDPIWGAFRWNLTFRKAM
jgi:DNA oxidative demethylase